MDWIQLILPLILLYVWLFPTLLQLPDAGPGRALHHLHSLDPSGPDEPISVAGRLRQANCQPQP